MRLSLNAVVVPGLAVMVLGAAAGCNQSPYGGAQRSAFPAAPVYSAQVQDLNQRASALDADNRDLHAELARSQQQVRVLQDEVGLLRGQLQEKATDLREMLLAKQDAEQRVESIESATRHRGGATLTANSSLRSNLQVVDVPGLEVIRDESTIRMVLPAERLLRPGTDQLLPTAQRLLESVAGAIRRSYSNQVIGIEGHSDGPAGNIGGHELTSAQAVAVLHALTRVNRLPERQFFTIGYGATRPRVSNATPAGRKQNQRIEIVVHPETLEVR